MDQIVHICSKDEWKAAQAVGEYWAESLESEGFIHFSKPEQAVDTANRYYLGHRDLLLLWVDPSKLVAELRFEPSDGEMFPHLYGSLNLDAILMTTDFSPDVDGVFQSLPEMLL